MTASRQHPRRVANWRLALDCALALVGLGIAVWRVAPALAATGDFGARIAEIHWGWWLLAALLGLASLVMYGVLHCEVLVATGSWLPVKAVMAITFVQNAFTQSLPSAAAVVADGYAATAFHRRGVNMAAAALTVAMASVISGGALLVVAPLLLASNGLLGLPTAAGLSVMLVTLLGVAWRVAQRPHTVRGTAKVVLRVAHKIPVVRNADWAMEQPEAAAASMSGRLSLLRLRRFHWVWFLITAYSGLVFDYAALWCSAAAASANVPWTTIAVGYLVVQASIAVQLTPGGTGPAEAGLIAALMAGGAEPGAAALAVVAYRVIAWLGLAAIGWGILPFLAGGLATETEVR